MSIADWRDWRLPEVRTRWSPRECTIYALGVGCGGGSADDLRFLRPEGGEALPTMAAVLGVEPMWPLSPEYGLDWRQILHGEHAAVLHAPLPPAGEVIGQTRIAGVRDRGPGKGSAMQLVRELRDAASGALLATVTDLMLARGDQAGAAGSGFRPEPPPPVPDRAPDAVHDTPTGPQIAHIYRLSGDSNPLHYDPEVARAAGFPRPILHGLATHGLAGRALLAMFGADDPGSLRSISVRFSAPAFPGDTIRTEAWATDSGVRFRARALERDAIVLDCGQAALR